MFILVHVMYKLNHYDLALHPLVPLAFLMDCGLKILVWHLVQLMGKAVPAFSEPKSLGIIEESTTFVHSI